MELNICHLYPDILNLYGDRGNIITHEAPPGGPRHQGQYRRMLDRPAAERGQIRHLLHRRRSGLRAGGAAARPFLRQGAGHPHRGRGGKDLSRHLRRLSDARPILQDLGRRAARLHRRHRRAHHRRKGAHDRQLYVQDHARRAATRSSSASRTTPARPISASRSPRSA